MRGRALDSQREREKVRGKIPPQEEKLLERPWH
jgi:hypothetical protein